jgi:hypothetical protein
MTALRIAMLSRATAAFFICGLVLSVPTSAQTPQPDTLRAPASHVVSDPPPRHHSPRGALYRAAAVPGWGQVYNRQYYKLPFVYGGLGAVAYGAWHNHQRYGTYQEAYLFAEPRLWENGHPGYPEFESAYRRMLELQGLAPDESLSPEEAAARRQRLAPNLRQIRDNYRRNRDLLYIGVGLFYGLTILDAYVSAHILDFDIGEDLTIDFAPTPVGLRARVQIIF